MNGQYPCRLDEKLLDKEQSYWWLKSGNIKGTYNNGSSGSGTQYELL